MAVLESQIEWNELVLVNALGPPYNEALRRVYNYVSPLLRTRPLGAEEFTDHDLQHSARVLQRAAQILPQQTQLNEVEVYILSLAALLHDAGLWTKKEEALELFESDEFRKHLDDSSASELKKIEEMLADERLRWMGELTLLRLVACHHRSLHPQRLCSVVLNPESEQGQSLRVLIGEEFVNAVATVSIAHSWTRERVLQDDALRDQQFGDVVVSLRFLAALVRLGDLLDLGEGRVSSLLWAYLAPLNSKSEAHWRKEATLKLELCGPEEIRIAGRFDVDQFGMIAAEAHRLAQDWLSMLREEIEGVALVLNSRIEDKHRKRLQFGRMDLDVERVEVNGLVLGGKVTFELSPSRVIELLSDEIYRDKSIFIRELLQNAVEATRTQLMRDKREGRFGAKHNLPEAEPWNWPKSVTDAPEYQIEVTASDLNHEDAPFVTFTIADQGIGMSLADIRDYFLQVGKSFYTTNRYRQEFSHSPISQFGIGFLSCLAIADRIEVTTRQRGEHAGLRLILQKPSEHFIVEQVNDAKPGTMVVLKIARSEMEELGLQTFPTRSTHFFSDSAKFCDALSEVVSQWAAYLEFPLVVQGTRIEPRKPATFVPWYIFQDKPTESLPVHVVSDDDREIARGRVFYEVLEPTHLSSLHSVTPQAHSVVSCRGIGLSDGRVSFSNHQAIVALDFRRLPRRALAARRMFRPGWTLFSRVGDRICHKLQALTVRELEAVCPELSVLWSFYLDRRMGSPRRDVDKLPVRTDADLTWESWEQICQRYPRVVLVPFHVAWLGAWNLSVPAVGLTNEGLNGLASPLDKVDARHWPIFNCKIVSVNDICSAYLWPPDADVGELDLLESKHTFSHIGLVMWANATHPRHLRDAVPIDERLVPEGELLAYDRQGDPWHRFGIHRYSRIDDGSIVSESARELFVRHSDWSLGGHENVVTLPDANDWV